MKARARHWTRFARFRRITSSHLTPVRHTGRSSSDLRSWSATFICTFISRTTFCFQGLLRFSPETPPLARVPHGSGSAPGGLGCGSALRRESAPCSVRPPLALFPAETRVPDGLPEVLSPPYRLL